MINPIIDACLDLAKSNVIDPKRIDHIELTVNPLTTKLTNIVDPKDRGQALVSLQHWAVVSLLQKSAGIAQVTDAVVRDPMISKLRHQVLATSVDSVGREAASVRVVLTDGTHLETSITNCRGSTGRPMTDDDITEKTRGQLRTAFDAKRVEQILEHSWDIVNLPLVAPYCKQLAAAGAPVRRRRRKNATR